MCAQLRTGSVNSSQVNSTRACDHEPSAHASELRTRTKFLYDPHARFFLRQYRIKVRWSKEVEDRLKLCGQ